MKKISLIVFICLSLNSILQAQNYTISLKSNFDVNRKENWNISLQLNGLQDVENGFALSFPANTHFVPIKIQAGGKVFWLKKDHTTPDSNNVIHWEKVDSLLILRFASNVSLEGGALTVQLNINHTRPGPAKGAVKWLNLQPDGRPGALLSQAEIQFQQSVTR